MNDPRTTSQRRRPGAATCLLALALLPGACKPQAPAGSKGGPQSSAPASVSQDFDVRPVSGPTIVARATERILTPYPRRDDPCLGKAGLAMPMGLHEYDSVEAVYEAFPGEFLVVDPNTLPSGSEFDSAYFHSAIEPGTSFRQSTMAITWFTGPPRERLDTGNPATKGIMARPELTVSQSTGLRMPDPPLEPHQRLQLRGMTAYGFNPPFERDQHSLTWQEGCRWITIVGILPASTLLKIAQGLKRSGQP